MRIIINIIVSYSQLTKHLLTISFARISPPCDINVFTTSVRPYSAALYNGVLPYCIMK